jgi:hypothetical protein
VERTIATSETTQTQHRISVRDIRSPAKFCDYCELAIVITEAEFYAQFGRMPW